LERIDSEGWKMNETQALQEILEDRKEVKRMKRLDQGLCDVIDGSFYLYVYILYNSIHEVIEVFLQEKAIYAI
jgi:hypothetical protein